MARVTDLPNDYPVISPLALSDALLALGAYTDPPTDLDLAAAERDEGRPALTARLANRPVRSRPHPRHDR